MFARTPRLLLRPCWAEDAPALAQALRGDRHSANSSADAVADAELFIAGACDTSLLRLLVTLRTDGAPLVLGTVGLGPQGAGRIGLTCWIDDRHRGNGYATEAVRAMLDIAATLGLPGVDPSNFVDLRAPEPQPEVPLAA